MEINLKNSLLFLTLVTTAFSAGLFYAWTISVIPGTKKVPNKAYLEVMQSINKEIINPWFFIIFFGALILLFISTYLQYKIKVDSIFWMMLTASIIYLMGTMGVTMLGNVPLNNILEAVDLTTLNADEMNSTRLAYEDKWNQFNLLRTIASVVSFLILLFAALSDRIGG